MSPKAAVLDRSQPPPPGELRPFHFPAVQRSQLANGLRIVAARLPRFPLLSLQALAPAGGQYDALGRPGLASLHGELLDEGSARRSALQLAERIEALGGSLSSGAGWNMAYVEIGLLARHLAPGLELVAEIVRTPSFVPEELERLRQERLAEILRRRGQPASLADRYLAAAVYRGTVYGHPLIGTEQSLKAATRERIEDFYRRHMVASGTTLIAVGDLDPGELHSRAAEFLGDWTPGRVPERPAIEPAPLAQTEVHLVDRPGSTQTQLQLGHRGLPRGHPDFPKLIVLNAILGGKFTSRINLNLRERHGYTYGAHSFFARRQGPGPFVIRAAVATEVAGAAVRELLFELRRIREEPVSEDELRETRDYLVGVFPYTLQTVGDLARRLEDLTVFDLPDDYYEGYPEVLTRVTRDEVLAAAREVLQPEHLAIVAVGPADDLRPQVEALGPVHVHTPG